MVRAEGEHRYDGAPPGAARSQVYVAVFAIGQREWLWLRTFSSFIVDVLRAAILHCSFGSELSPKVGDGLIFQAAVAV
jgi:hypothetical protein